jgi:nitric oxide reductase subunit B
MEFMEVQKEIEIHFVVLLICATMFTVGISLFIYDFIKYGRPTDEALEIEK